MDSLSIKPRNWNGTPHEQRDKSNTCGQKKRATLDRVINAIAGHLARHPRDGMSAAHLAKLKAKLSALPVKREPSIAA